ncbi:MAG: MotA/TolQ/ExbB proton channel family protein [Lachnospiraceae bacterium]|nr:MotA/TolQ/ExbB proton channel family protein [Lachnospiraceae bacterium]
MDSVLNLISRYGTAFIVVCALIVLFSLSSLLVKLSSHKNLITEIMQNKGNIRSRINRNTLEVSDALEDGEKVTPDTIREHEKHFNRLYSGFEVCSQLIPLFPLLGILGTVAGLMLAVRGVDTDINALIEGLNTALPTTFAGLIAAIVLKAFATLGPARIIYDLDIMYSDYDKRFENAVKLNSITEE